jgi:hypothetical protein
MSNFDDMQNYLASAKAAVKYVISKMDIGASNKMQPWEWKGKVAKILCTGSAINKGAMREAVDKDLAELNEIKGKVGWKEAVDVFANQAKQWGCGNCGEQSALAFVYLRDHKVGPRDWMQIGNFAHAFVVVGRPADSDEADCDTWGKKAVVCDPWSERAEPAMPYANIWFVNKKIKLLHREG